MKSGSNEHKAQFVEEKLKILNENIWEQEILILTSQAEIQPAKENVELKQARVDEIKGKLERREYESAAQGNKELEPAVNELKEAEERLKVLTNTTIRLHEDIEKNKAMIERLTNWSKDNKPKPTKNGKTEQIQT